MKSSGIEKSNNILHISFEIGLLLKFINGLMEIIGGILFLFLSSDRLIRIVTFLTQSELSEDPNDKIANALLTFSHSFSISTQYFGVYYLMSHGIIKVILILLLWKKKLWAYPLSIAFLISFIIYQVYRYSFTHSPMLILLTIFDLIMIYLTVIEYKRQKWTASSYN